MASSMKGFEHLEIQLEEIKSATNNFNEENVIGHGGFGKVYKGELSHSHSEGKSIVALKRLDRRHGQGDAEFHKEVRMLSCYRHENIISLLGFSSGREEMILVYEYASHGSLDGYLKDVNLTWTQRLKICLDAAKGLSYLHDPRETYQRLIHCDIKSANILLDENLKAKVSDFGLSKIGPANQQNSMLVTSALGTPGYCDPVFIDTYTLTKESDVYSFGVVLFEVLCGKLCVEYSKGQLKVIHMPMWKQSYEENKLDRIILEDIKQQMNRGSLETFSGIAYQCLKRLREERPTMSLVVEKLELALQMQMLPKEYVEIANATVDPLLCGSLEEFEELLSKGVFLDGGKTDKLLNVAFEETLVEPNMLVVDVEKFVSPEPESWFSVDAKESVGYALVEIVEGSDMKPSDMNGLADPYIKGKLGSKRFRTKTQKKTLFPEWFEEFKIPIVSWDAPNLLEIEVRDKNRFVDDTLGKCVVKINDFKDGERHEMWLPLDNITTGRLHLVIKVIEVVEKLFEQAQVWEPRKGKNRVSKVGESVSSSIRVEPYPNDSSSSDDESLEGNKPKSRNPVIRGFHKVGSLFSRRPKTEDDKDKSKDIGANLVMEDNHLATGQNPKVVEFEESRRK